MNSIRDVNWITRMATLQSDGVVGTINLVIRTVDVTSAMMLQNLARKKEPIKVSRILRTIGAWPVTLLDQRKELMNYSDYYAKNIEIRGNGQTYTMSDGPSIVIDVSVTFTIYSRLVPEKTLNDSTSDELVFIGGVRYRSRRYSYDLHQTLFDSKNDSCTTTTYKEEEKTMTEHQKQYNHIFEAKIKLYNTHIVKIIYNDKATIVFWNNNTKTVVKCTETDEYSKEAAVAIAFFKHSVGDEYYHYVMDALTGNKGDSPKTHTRTIKIID